MAVCPAVTVADVEPRFDGSMAKFIAVPVRGIDWGVSGALSARTTEAARAPTEAGMNVTLITHAAAGAIGGLQVSFSRKSAAFAPENEMAPMTRAPVPVLVTVIAAGELAAPTNWLAKFMVEGERETAA